MIITDTICAVATPAGKGGISVIRVSGTKSSNICEKITGFSPKPGTLKTAAFRDSIGNTIDQGLILFFSTPHSFTGEDVCEFHTHGSPVVADLLLTELINLGCRLARPGEFSERAFLNDKIDLAQAEAIADLIDSSSTMAARYAVRSLQGEFSRLINTLVSTTTRLRVYIEASLDFPEEEVDFLGTGRIAEKLSDLQQQVNAVLAGARQGAVIKEGITVVIAGAPNVGKSTLLNVLSGTDMAIVTDIPGTTRDVIRQEINLGGLPLHIIDTAGIRDSDDPVEQEGIRRAKDQIASADRILLIVDSGKFRTLHEDNIWQQLGTIADFSNRLTLVINKIDLTGSAECFSDIEGIPCIQISAKHNLGLTLLKKHLQDCAGFNPENEGGFIARRRHLDALLRTQSALANAVEQLTVFHAGELVAEELRNAQLALGEITGIVTADDLLGEIFGSFCIGK
ncbi:MAG: tRNA uridine-5-carboxymethylaminomethyl(34) synthesis GTPase MnmE [Pseudomonadota bacterium]